MGLKILDNEEIRLRIGNLAFTWDDVKTIRNFRKHKVTFELAVEVFLDDSAFERENTSADEFRFEIVGMARIAAELLFVVFAERVTMDNEEVLRIISARKATRKERVDYEKQFHDAD
jgi:uncharacterized DUF497 family protein